MRNYFKFAFFAFAMTLVACSTDDGITDGGNNGNGALPVKNAQTFTASLEKNSTRTSSTLSDDDTWSTIWTLKDAIKVSGSSVTKSFQIANESDIVDGTTATFTNTSDEKLESTEGFYAVYPDVDGLTLSGNTVTGKIPSMQPLETATGINPNYQIMTGYASENAFAFKNLVSFFKVNITNNTIFKTVKIVSNNNVKIAGDFTATIANTGVPTVSVTDNNNARTFVEVRSTSALDGTYYLAVLPTAGSVDVTLMLEGDYTDANGQQIYQRVKAEMAFARNNVYDFGTYDCSNSTLKAKTLSRVVDLGLPSGTLWCLDDVSNSNDVSATRGYYAWGEVQSKAADMYDWNYTSSWGRTTSNYKHGVGVDRIPVLEMFNQTISDNFIRVSNSLVGGTVVNGAAGMLKKYNSQDGYTRTIFDWFGSGVQDKLIELEPDDDAAYQSNNLLVTPLMDQAKELLNYTIASGYSRISKVAGYTTRSVKFAATGFKRDGTSTFANPANSNGNPYKYENLTTTGYYWTKTRAHSSDGQGEYVMINGENKRSDFMAKSLEITNGGASVMRADRCEGRKVRPVVGNTNIKTVAAEDHYDQEETNN